MYEAEPDIYEGVYEGNMKESKTEVKGRKVKEGKKSGSQRECMTQRIRRVLPHKRYMPNVVFRQSFCCGFGQCQNVLGRTLCCLSPLPASHL